MNERLRDIVGSAFDETWDAARARGVPLRHGGVRRSPSSASPRRRTITRALSVGACRLLVARPSCHLLRAGHGSELCGAARGSSAVRASSEVDITGVPELERAYREWIPVVEVDGERRSVYRVEPSRCVTSSRDRDELNRDGSAVPLAESS